jgi:hypothetical protein
MRLIVLLALSLLLVACSPPTPTAAPPAQPSPTPETFPTADNAGQGGGLPAIGEVGLEPSDASPCLITPQADTILVYAAPDSASQALARLNMGHLVATFEYNPADFYAIRFVHDNKEQVGWLIATQTRTIGECAALYPADNSGQGGGKPEQ